MTSLSHDETGGERGRIWSDERPDILLKQVPFAKERQRAGMTFTEIADELRVSRPSVVKALYWDILR